MALSPTALAKAVADRDYVAAPLAEATALKGSRPASVQVYPADVPYAPPVDALRKAIDARALLFLTQSGIPPKAYFAGRSPRALVQATRKAEADVRAEIARQTIAPNARPIPSPHDAEVRRLIAELGALQGRAKASARQRAIFTRLEGLGPAAVPAIVAHMDDHRPLVEPTIALANHGQDAFEGQRHYGPSQVVDALAAILEQITGESFGDIDNGGTEAQRREVVKGWRTYVADLDCPRA